MGKIRLKIREDIQTTPIEVTTFLSDVADEEQFFFNQTYNESESEEQTWFSMNEMKVSARVLVEEDVDLVLKNLKLKILGQSYNEVLLTTDERYKHYKTNEDHVFLKDGRLFRKYYAETVRVKH